MKRNQDRTINRPGIRTGAYSYSGKLRVGGAVQGGAPAIRTQVSFYSEEDPRQRPGGIYTVQFDVNTAATQVGADVRRFVNPVATVAFSTEGNSVTRRFSIVNGTSISGVCDHVEVFVQDETSLIPDVFGSELDYIVGITIAPWTRPPRANVPPFLRGVMNLVVAAGASSDQPVPEGAGVTSVCVYASLGSPRVSFRNADLTQLGAYVPADLPVYVPLIPETAFVRLSNDAGAPASTVFAVLFGVDG